MDAAQQMDLLVHRRRRNVRFLRRLVETARMATRINVSSRGLYMKSLLSLVRKNLYSYL